MYKYFDFKKIFEAEEPKATTSEPTVDLVDIKEINKEKKLHILLNQDNITTLSDSGSLTKVCEWKGIENETDITNMIVSLYIVNDGETPPSDSTKALRLIMTRDILDNVILDGIRGGKTVEVKMDSANPELEGEKVNVVFTREIDITNVKADEIAAPAAEEAPTTTEVPESFGGLMKFDDFVNEAKKKEQWIKDVPMKKGALKKSLHKEDITSADIAKELKKLEGKDKDKKKEGLQLGKKDATKQKRLVLAKNLMKASGADKKSKKK